MADIRTTTKDGMRNTKQAMANKRKVTGVPSREGIPAGDHLAARVIVEKPDYYICAMLDVFDTRPVVLAEATVLTGRDIIEVAKNLAFRRSHLHMKSRPNRDGGLNSYVYNDANGTDRTVTEVDSDPVLSEDQVVTPVLLPEQTIDAVVYAGSYFHFKRVRNGTGVKNDAGDDLFLVDTNSRGSQWAEKDTS